MNKITTYSSALAVMALTLTACGGVMDDDHPNTVPEAIRITTSLNAQTLTRAAKLDEQATLLSKDNKLGVFVYKTGTTTATKLGDNQSGTYGYANEEFTVGELTAGGTKNVLNHAGGAQIPYPADASNIDVYMYAPYVSSVSALNAEQTFTVTADQNTASAAADYINNDVLWGEVKNNTFNTDVDCKLSHKFAKVVVNIKFGPDRQGSYSDLANIISVKLKGVYLTSKLNFATGAVKDANQVTTEHKDITFWLGDKPTAQATDMKQMALCVLPPQQTMVGTTLEIVYQSDPSDENTKVTYSYTGSSTEAFTFYSGKVTTFTFSISPDGIQNLSTDITNWDDGTTTLPSTEHAF
jgi:hypothetical protein